MEEPADANVKDRITIGNSDAVTSVANIDQNNQMRHGPLTRPFLFHSIDIVLPVSGYSGGTSPPPPLCQDLERMAASTAYWKGLQLRGNPRQDFPSLVSLCYDMSMTILTGLFATPCLQMAINQPLVRGTGNAFNVHGYQE